MNADTCDRSVVEGAIGVICSSISSLSAFFRRNPPKFPCITKPLRSMYWIRSGEKNQDQPDGSRTPVSKLAQPQQLRVETQLSRSINGLVEPRSSIRSHRSLFPIFWQFTHGELERTSSSGQENSQASWETNLSQRTPIMRRLFPASDQPGVVITS